MPFNPKYKDMIGNKSKEEKKGRLFFLNVKDGKIVHKDGLLTNEYDFVEGTLESITQKEREFNGETLLYWYLNLRDDSGDLYSLGLPYSSGVFKSIILSLAGDENLTPLSTVRIETYLKDGFTKVKVYDGDKSLDWIVKQLPPVQEVKVGGKTIKDDTERMKYIASLVEAIQNRI